MSFSGPNRKVNVTKTRSKSWDELSLGQISSWLNDELANKTEPPAQNALRGFEVLKPRSDIDIGSPGGMFYKPMAFVIRL